MFHINISSVKMIGKGKMALRSLAVLLLVQNLSSCSKMLDVDVPKNMRESETVFNSNTTANAAVNGLYSLMYSGTNNIFNGQLSQLTGMSADEFIYSASRDSYDQFTANTLPTLNNSDNVALWTQPYTFIYRANAIIEGLSSSSSQVSDSLKKQYTAEARFIRAFCHFYLTNMFGKVPLITTTDVTVTALQPRASIDTVYGKIIEDLLYAENTLAKDYRYSPTSGDRTRVNKWAAAALLSRVYLYRQQWDLAAKQASLVIDSAGLYTLADISTSSPFYKNSTEAIWQYYTSPTNIYGTNEATIFRPTSATVAYYPLRDTLLNSFEASDKRKANWTLSFTPSGSSVSYRVPLKYKNVASVSYTGSILESYTLLRLSEQYLIRAEALAHSSTNLTQAISDLNKVHNRAGLGTITPGDATSLLTAIAKERQLELFAEMGHRWFDLKRTNTADALLKVLKPATWKSTAVLYPVPEEAILSNYNLLPQNSGY